KGKVSKQSVGMYLVSPFKVETYFKTQETWKLDCNTANSASRSITRRMTAFEKTKSVLENAKAIVLLVWAIARTRLRGAMAVYRDFCFSAYCHQISRYTFRF